MLEEVVKKWAVKGRNASVCVKMHCSFSDKVCQHGYKMPGNENEASVAHKIVRD